MNQKDLTSLNLQGKRAWGQGGSRTTQDNFNKSVWTEVWAESVFLSTGKGKLSMRYSHHLLYAPEIKARSKGGSFCCL